MESFESLNSVTVIWRGNKYVVEMNPDASLKNLGDQLQKLTNVKADTLRLIVPQVSGKGSKLLSPYSKEHSYLSLQEASIVKGKPIRMMGASEDEVEKVQQDAKDHLRIAGFDEEERRMRLRMSPRFNSLIKLPQGPYTFGGFRTLQLPGIELNPPASEALKRMHMLAADPGIVAIMNKHRWSAGIMTEMAPVGYVGISPKCILGFNKNCGEEISLRLRTDDLKGFRKYESIKKTLLHELAHMVFSEHDANFFALDKQLNQEAAALDWTKSRGNTLAAVRSLDYDEEDYDSSDKNYVSHKLGGDASDQLGSARASSVAAAYRRFKDMSEVKSEVSEVHQEPDPDDSSSTLETRPNEMDYLKEVTVLDESSLENPLEQDYEADLDDSSRECEPDSDDLNSGAQTIDEPDPDDLEAKQIKSIDRNIHLSDHNGVCVTNKEPDPDDLVATAELSGMKIDESMAHEEPDPDDSELKKNNSGNEYQYRLDWGTKVAETMAEPASPFKANEEPDPDDSHANRVARDEPDHGNGLVGSEVTSNMAIDEPDPDDQELQRIQDPVSVICNQLMKAVEMLRTEANPTEASTALQTLFKIIRNVIEHPNETKFKRLRKANPVIQKNVAKYKVAMEILQMIGFVEEAILDGSGMTETYIVLKRNDPGLLWLAKSCLEGSVAC